MEPMQLRTVVWKEDSYYVTQCLNVEVSSFGETREEALKNLDEALALYFEDNSDPEINNVEFPELVITTFSKPAKD